MRTKDYRINILLSQNEKEMIRELKQKFSINISNHIRNSIRDLHEKLTKRKSE